jgi:transketolase
VDGADFVIGKAQLLAEGTDISLFACGHMVWKCIEAAQKLAEEGISAEVINIHTLKPLDTEAILKSISKQGVRLLQKNTM